MNAHPTEDPVSKRRGNPPLSNAAYDERYFARLRKRTIVSDDGCFVWQGPVTSKGYIMLTHRRWKVQAHRVVYKIVHNVELPTEQFVCHGCDNRRCWNHNHLFLGTAKVNNRDCGNKGRHHNGVKTHCKRGHALINSVAGRNNDHR